MILLCAYLQYSSVAVGWELCSESYLPILPFLLLLNMEQPAVRVRLSLTRVSVACSQEWLWPTWTPAWQDTKRQPPWTLVRGSTCWTWSPLARRSRRLPTHGNNWKRALLAILVLVLFHSFSSTVNSNPQRIFKQMQSLTKWRNIPFLPLYDHYFRFLIFCHLF